MYLLSKLVFVFYIVFSVEKVKCNSNSDLGKVLFVNIMYRHGARTPIGTYKNDPHKGAFPQGFGQLTNVGKNQQYELGKWLRKRYGADGLLPDIYSRDVINITSSDVDRVIMSAECNLAGMFPPKGWQVWNEELNWQPIPIHTLPAEYDKILGMTASCPKYDEEMKILLDSNEIQQLFEKYQYIIKILNKYTGETHYDYQFIAKVNDVFTVQRENNLELPKWAKEIFPCPMREATVRLFTEPTWNKKLARLKTGPLLQELIGNMQAKIKEGSKSVMHVYAAHDTTITNLLHTLDVWDMELPPYATCVMLELRRDSTGAHYVTLFYRTSALEEPRLLTIPGCDAACPLDKFISITQPLIPQDWDYECGNVK